MFVTYTLNYKIYYILTYKPTFSNHWRCWDNTFIIIYLSWINDNISKCDVQIFQPNLSSTPMMIQTSGLQNTLPIINVSIEWWKKQLRAREKRMFCFFSPAFFAHSLVFSCIMFILLSNFFQLSYKLWGRNKVHISGLYDFTWLQHVKI